MGALVLRRGPVALLAWALPVVWLLAWLDQTGAGLALVAAVAALTTTAADPRVAALVRGWPHGYRPRHAAPGRYPGRHLAAVGGGLR